MRERSRFDWVELIEGILLILLGFYSISHPGSALTVWYCFTGWLQLSQESQILCFM